MTEAHGDEAAADLIAAFCHEVRQLLREHGAEEVKAIGDAVMIRADSAGAAIQMGLRIAREVGGRHRFPAVRVGIHTGSAVARGNDWFGGTVNLASRVSDHAAAGEVLVTEATRVNAVDEVEGVELVPRGQTRFKNISRPVEVWAAVPRGEGDAGRQPEIDPVCRMAVIPERAFGTAQHRGRTFYFCSEVCAEAFGADPERHA